MGTTFQYPLGDRRFGKCILKTCWSQRLSFSILWGIEGLERFSTRHEFSRSYCFSILWGIEGLESLNSRTSQAFPLCFSILWGIEGLER